MRKAVPLGALLLGVVLVSAASADVTITIKETDGLDGKKPRVSTGAMSFNADCMSTRWEGAEREHGRVIFRGDKDVMWVVNDGKKSYQQLDKAFFDQMGAQLTDAQAQMKAQLEKMPPEQRAQAEEMMKKFGGAAAGKASAPRIDYRKTAETRVINGHKCTKYDTYLGKDLISYAWVAPYSAMKLSASDAAVFEKMAKFVEKMTSALGVSQKQDYIPMHELGGVPLLTQQVKGGKVTSETLVESVSRGPVPPGSYELPAGYKAEATPGARRSK